MTLRDSLKWICVFCLSGCLSGSELTQYERLCKRTGGVFLDCEAAFAAVCAEAKMTEGKPVVCSCPAGKAWQDGKGCR